MVQTMIVWMVLSAAGHLHVAKSVGRIGSVAPGVVPRDLFVNRS